MNKSIDGKEDNPPLGKPSYILVHKTRQIPQHFLYLAVTAILLVSLLTSSSQLHLALPSEGQELWR